MLTPEENNFIAYWQDNRNRKKKLIWQLAAGLPVALLVAGGTFVTYFSDWYTRAIAQINMRSSGVLVVIIGLILVVVFIVIFSARHRWDMNEQHYKELIAKKSKS